jgi:hypothetical protein
MKTVELELPKFIGRINNYDLMFGTPIPPIEKLKIFSAEQFEDFIREWATGFLKKQGKYLECKKCSGAGDKGRDVIAIIDSAKWENFQCKHYDHPLSPSDVYVELGKLLYYTHKKDYTVPHYYYFVSPRGLGPKLNDLLSKPDELKTLLFNSWETYCKKGIISNQEILLEETFLDYFNSFDFSIFKGYDPHQLIEEHHTTPYYACRFGGGLQKKRSFRTAPPSSIATNELVYTTKLFAAYTDFKKISISCTLDLTNDDELFNHFNRQREGFYSADSLNQFSRDTFPTEVDYFDDLKNEFYRGVVDVANNRYADGYQRVKATTNFAKTLNISSNPLGSQVNMEDREGICHHLANEDKLTWVKN